MLVLFRFFTLLFLCVSFIWASNAVPSAPAIAIISFEPVNLGKLQQGEKREVVLSGKNNSKGSIEVENVINQMTGGENFRFPKVIAPNAQFKIQFTLNTAYMEGDFAHNIVLIETNGKPHVGIVQGSIENPIVFSERYFDLGYYSQGNSKEWTFYVWGASNKPLRLKLAANSEFEAVFSAVNLDVKDFDNIREGGSTPGIKVKLSVKKLELPKNNQKSIRRIVSFTSEDFPNATPEIQVIGYWR
jgi:hypothetical protein